MSRLVIADIWVIKTGVVEVDRDNDKHENKEIAIVVENSRQ